MYDEEFDWSNPNYGFKHHARLVDAEYYHDVASELSSWVEDYWLELAQLAWNGYNEGYRGVVVAQAKSLPYEVEDLAGWLTDPRIPSFMGLRDVWYLSWQENRVPDQLFSDSLLRGKVATYDPKAQLVIVFLDLESRCEGHFLAYCQDAYPVNAKECSDQSLHHMITKYGSRYGAA
jgi:hypothetical protein